MEDEREINTWKIKCMKQENKKDRERENELKKGGIIVRKEGGERCKMKPST